MRVVFDLDGTLADVGHRLHHIQSETPDWDAFFAACHKDTVIQEVALILRLMMKEDHISVEIWSGRSRGKDNEIYNTTATWIRDKVLGIRGTSERPLHLLMREHGDHRPDVEIKREWLCALRKLDKDVDLVFEDRTAVVEMWRAEGITCYQVAPGDF